jgi:hypothetical protein
MTNPKIIQDVKELGDELFNNKDLKAVYLIVAQLMEEYGEDAILTLDAYDDYLETTITFDRPETEKEKEKRLRLAKEHRAWLKRSKDAKLARERKEYERLKKKFGD